MDNSMPTSTTQLRQYIRSVLVEGAISSAQAKKQGLALYVGRVSSQRMYVLYDPSELVDEARSHMDPDDDDSWADVETNPAFARFVVAMVTVKPPKKGRGWNAATITTSAAEHGYGPMLYDIVMAEEGGLASDRRAVSSPAKNVWQYYHDRRLDVKAKLFDDESDPKTKTKVDDARVHRGGEANPLNYAYFATKKPSITQLKANHNRVMKQLTKLGIHERLFVTASMVFFNQKDEK